MIKMFSFFFDIFPRLIAWIYLFGALFYIFIFIKQIKNNFSVGKWLLFILNVAYVLLFLVLRLFFVQLWEFVFSVLGIIAIAVAFIWAKYEDRRDGRRWWNW